MTLRSLLIGSSLNEEERRGIRRALNGESTQLLMLGIGTAEGAPIAETTLESYRRVTEVNQTGVFLGMKSVIPAMKRAGIDLKNPARGGRGQNLEGVIDERANWKSHNYSHLLEQPTLFYAVSLIIALLGASPTAILAAWIYVALRIVHSFWQATVNVVSIRFTLFALSTLALGVLALRAIELTLFANPGVVS